MSIPLHTARRQVLAETGPVDRLRDDFEIALVRGALARDMPVLATCRGMQVLNVAFGGPLRQHLPGREGAAHRRRQGEWTRHRMSLAAGSLAARAAGDEQPEVDSHHHQAIDRVAPGFRVSGRAGDGVIERSRMVAQLRAECAVASGGRRGERADRALVAALGERPLDDRAPSTGR